jgi:hypothetical protein
VPTNNYENPFMGRTPIISNTKIQKIDSLRGYSGHIVPLKEKHFREPAAKEKILQTKKH